VHKVRAGNRRGGWYRRAYRRHKGRLSNCYLGVSANLTLPRLCEAARRLTTRSEGTVTRKEAEDAGDGSQTTASSDLLAPILILHTKFALPRLPMQHVSRPHLLAFLEQGVQRPLTLVSAPAGSGKTTLLAEWAATTTLLVVVRLSLEVVDNDPARFLSYLLATLAQLDERVSSATPANHPWYARDYEQALTAPLNDLMRLLQQDAVVILDDYHLITTDAVHACVHFLLEHLPARLHLMIGTRVDPPLPLARLRARNQLSELRIEDLRFAPPEVEAFALTMGLTLTSEALSLLHTRTEGWIAGIQLLVLALSGHADAAAFLRVSGSTHRFLLD
jgi:LuxR family maltose regulon positive regulatory protein